MTPPPPPHPLLHPLPLLLLLVHLNRTPGARGAERPSGKKTGTNRTERRDMTPRPLRRLPPRKRERGGRGAERGSAEIYPRGRQMRETTGKTPGRDRRGRRLLASRKTTGEGTAVTRLEIPRRPPLARPSPTGVRRKETAARDGEIKTERASRRGTGT